MSFNDEGEDGIDSVENQQCEMVDGRAIKDHGLSFQIWSKEEADNSAALAPVTQEANKQSCLNGPDLTKVKSDEKIGTVVSTFSGPSSKKVWKAQFHALIQDRLFPQVDSMPLK